MKVEYLHPEWNTFPKSNNILDTDLMLVSLGNSEHVEVQWRHANNSLVLTHWIDDFCQVIHVQLISSWSQVDHYLSPRKNSIMHCPECSHEIEVAKDFLGDVTCPSCKIEMTISPDIMSSLLGEWEKPTFWERCWYFVTSKWNKFLNFFRELSQKYRFGFPLYEVWTLKCAHSDWILPRLRKFRDTVSGYPNNFSSVEEWQAAIDKMIWSFEHHDDLIRPTFPEGYDHRFVRYKIGDLTYSRCMEEELSADGFMDQRNKHNEKVQEGLDLFGKHYLSLWD